MGKFKRDGTLYECIQYRESEILDGNEGQEDLLVPECGWVIKDADGHRDVVENAEFQETFELAEERYL